MASDARLSRLWLRGEKRHCRASLAAALGVAGLSCFALSGVISRYRRV